MPKERRKRLSIVELNEGLLWRPVVEVVDKYVKALEETKEGCVELYGHRDHPFDWM